MNTYEMRCAGCGMAIGRGDRFCRFCGVSQASRAGTQEHRYITALYSDLNRYTSLSAILDPEELKSIMGSIFQEATRTITSFGGVIEKFSGDAVVALFGVHLIHEDDIVRAIRSAITLHAFVQKEMGNRSGEQFTMHTGIHTGTALVDQETGNNLCLGAMGMPINIAARLSSIAAPGEILIDDSSRNEAERFFHTEFVGNKILKGIKEPVSAYRVHSMRRIPLSIHRPAGIPSPMVGREEQMALLMNARNNLLRGRGAYIVISGEAGVGKSRLIHEFFCSLPDEVASFTIQCLDHMKDTPYYPVISMIRQMVGMMGENGIDLDRIIEEQLTNPRHAFHIRTLLGSVQECEDLMPDIWKTEIFEALSALMLSFSQTRPLALCIEDIHWADPTTKDLLHNLILSDAGGIQCLFVVTSREEHRMHASGITIPLKELSRENTGNLIMDMLGGLGISNEAVDSLYRRTGGNPFYIEEYTSFLREKGISLLMTVAGENTRAIPSTIQGLITARLDNLGASCRNLLQAASIIGMVFSPSLLEAISSNEQEIPASLETLEKAGFIISTRSDEYRFRHALTREVVSMALLKRNRGDLHRKIGLHLEMSSKSRTENCGMIAYHLFHALEHARAYPYCMLSARTYQAEGSWIEASAHYRMAQLCLEKSQDYPDRDDLLIKIGEGIWSCSRIFNPDQAISALENLICLYRKAGHKNQEIFSQIRLINLYSQKGLFQKALDAFDDVVSKAYGNDFLIAAAKTSVAYTYTYLGKPMTALKYLEEARNRLDSSDRFLLSVNYLTALAASIWRGSMTDALAWYSRMKEQSSPYMDLDLMAEVWHGYILFLKGDILDGQRIFDEVREKEKKLGCLAGGFSYLRIQSSIYLYSRYSGCLEKAQEELEKLEESTVHESSPSALLSLYRAWIGIEQGQYQMVRDLIENALPHLEAGIANRVPYALNALAEALLSLGDLTKASEIASRSIDWNCENGNMDQLIWARRIMGCIYLRQDRKDAAEDSLSTASRLAWEMKMKPHVAWTVGSWGDLHASSGKWKKAKSCYARAITLWRGMGNTYQAEKIEAVLTRLPT